MSDDQTMRQPAVDDDHATALMSQVGGADPDAETTDPLRVAMASSDPTGGIPVRPVPQVSAGEVYAGRYRLEQQLAQRGATLTWRAFDQKLSRSVLVHLLDADDERTHDVLEVARKAAAATDSRFLRVLDAVPSEGPSQPALVVCEFAPGESLEKLLQQGPLSALEAAWIARELADAMAPMHADGLFHQRINPDTVIITATGNVKVVGFLIEAAMYPDAHDESLAWSEREQADVQAIGKVLYASLVTQWPTASQPSGTGPELTWGMPPAAVDAHGWVTPRQVRSGVSPALDTICDQVLSPAPRHNEAPIRSANQLVAALGRVLGTADAAADLERRLRYPLAQVRTNVARPDRSQRGPVTVPGGVDLPDTAQMQAFSEADTTVGGPAVMAAPATSSPTPASPPTPTQAPTPPVTVTAKVRPTPEQRGTSLRTGRPAGTPVTRPRGRRPGPRRWLWMLVGLFVLALLAGLLRVGLRAGRSSSGLGATRGPLTVTSVKDFDPTQDGGNDQENPDQAKLATDGNASTAWQTVVYLNDSHLGRLKPGVGLVLDLGEQHQVSSVDVTLQGSGSAVQLRVPAQGGATSAPMTSQKQWTTVASTSSAGAKTTLTPSSPVQTRFLLVYLTNLPKVGDAKYRGGIAELTVNR